MILSFGLILVLGFIAGFILNKIKIPSLVGFIVMGILIGPYCLNLLDSRLLSISSELRQIALVIILTRSGLNLDIKELKRIGRPAFLMCFLPATMEIIGTTLGAYFLLNIPLMECILLGTVLGAVSPAVVSPRMIKLIESGKKNVPSIILAGSSADDIYVIVLFYTFLGLTSNGSFNPVSIMLVPVSIILGILLGLLTGLCLTWIFKVVKMDETFKVIILLGISLLMVGLEEVVKPYINISCLLGVMVVGMIILLRNKDEAKLISDKYNSLWKAFEIILFVLVGASVNINYALNNSLIAIAVLLIGLTFRMLGVFLSLLKTKLSSKEKVFALLAYIPKATVQASIGGIALSSGIASGEIILTVAVLSILITAPIGAVLIDNLGDKLLINDCDYTEENC